MEIIKSGKDKGWCRCERCGCLLLPDRARYAEHLKDCDGTDSVSLARYVAWIADLPQPTKQEKEDFADYVAHSHSWYKLSPFPPGCEFHFFIDRYAGFERKQGAVLVAERTQFGPHYSQIPTDVYRSAFGCLAYDRGRRNKALLVMPVVGAETNARKSGMPPLVGEHTLEYGLPEAIFDAGTTRLTGAMHTLCANSWLWDSGRSERVDWPRESGGLATLAKILERSHQLQADPSEHKSMTQNERSLKRYPSSHDHLFVIDAILYELLAPERQRQHGEIIKAIDRVCEVIARHK